MENLQNLDRYQISQLIRSKANSIDLATRTCKPDTVQKKSDMEYLDLLLKEWNERDLAEGPDIIWAKHKSMKFKLWLKDQKPDINPFIKSGLSADPNEIFGIIKSRRSVRYWKKKKVPMDIIVKILEAGSWAPSAFNRLPWRFFVAETSLKDMAEGDAGNPGMFASAPVRIFVGVDERLFFEKYSGPLDAGLAMQNMLLMAHALGLGTCLIYQGEYMDPSILEKHYRIPTYCKVYCAILMGFPDEDPEPPARMNIDEITEFLGEIPNPVI